MDVLQFDVETTWPTSNDAVLLPMSGDPTKLPTAEPEQQTKPPPESIPDSESASPYEPERYLLFRIRGNLHRNQTVLASQ